MKFLDLFTTIEFQPNTEIEFPLDLVAPGYKRGFVMINSTEVFYPNQDIIKIPTFKITFKALEKLAARMIFGLLSRQDVNLRSKQNKENWRDYKIFDNYTLSVGNDVLIHISQGLDKHGLAVLDLDYIEGKYDP